MTPRLIVALCLALAARAATTNTTFDDTDPRITYSGTWHEGLPCVVNEDGTFASGQAGCFNIQPTCTTSFKFSQTVGDSATIRFNGTSVTVGLLSSDITSVVSVSLDGAIPDTVDMHGDTQAFTCAPLISKTGLDGTKEHSLVVTLAGASSQSKLNATQIMIDSVTVTSDGSTVTGSASASTSAPSTTETGAGVLTRSASWTAYATMAVLLLMVSV